MLLSLNPVVPLFLAKRYEAKNVMPLLVGEKMKMGFCDDSCAFSGIASQITVATYTISCGA